MGGGSGRQHKWTLAAFAQFLIGGFGNGWSWEKSSLTTTVLTISVGNGNLPETEPSVMTLVFLLTRSATSRYKDRRRCSRAK